MKQNWYKYNFGFVIQGISRLMHKNGSGIKSSYLFCFLKKATTKDKGKNYACYWANCDEPLTFHFTLRIKVHGHL